MLCSKHLSGLETVPGSRHWLWPPKIAHLLTKPGPLLSTEAQGVHIHASVGAPAGSADGSQDTAVNVWQLQPRGEHHMQTNGALPSSPVASPGLGTDSGEGIRSQNHSQVPPRAGSATADTAWEQAAVPYLLQGGAHRHAAQLLSQLLKLLRRDLGDRGRGAKAGGAAGSRCQLRSLPRIVLQELQSLRA